MPANLLYVMIANISSLFLNSRIASGWNDSSDLSSIENAFRFYFPYHMQQIRETFSTYL